MNLFKIIQLFFCIFCMLLIFFYFNISATSQTSENSKNPVQKYDEIIDLNSLESIKVIPSPQEKTIEKENTPAANVEIEQPSPTESIPLVITEESKLDDLVLLLPKLDNPIYQGWKTLEEPKISSDAETELLKEFGIEKALKQFYKKGDDGKIVEILISKFKDFSGAYSAYTVLHSGATTKLMVGKNASEGPNSVNFWKENYLVIVYTQAEDDPVSKEFIILASQDVSKNIKGDRLPPVVAIQLPALNRVQGSEKYCLGPLCYVTYLPFLEFEPEVFNLSKSGGIIAAQYQLSESEKERITLALTRYIDKDTANAVYETLKQKFEEKKAQNKDIDIDIEDLVIRVKNKKNNYTFLKQKGNLLALAYNVADKKSGEKILDLIPWPIEIVRPAKTVDGD